MESDVKKVKIAINGGIRFGSKLNANQLMTISKYMGEEQVLQLSPFVGAMTMLPCLYLWQFS